MTECLKIDQLDVEQASKISEAIPDALILRFALTGIFHDDDEIFSKCFPAATNLLAPMPIQDHLLCAKSDEDAQYYDCDLAKKLAPAVQRFR